MAGPRVSPSWVSTGRWPSGMGAAGLGRPMPVIKVCVPFVSCHDSKGPEVVIFRWAGLARPGPSRRHAAPVPSRPCACGAAP